MPILGGSRNAQVRLLRWQRKVLIVGIQISFCLVGVPSLFHPFLDLPSANRREVFEFHPGLNSGKPMGAVVYGILLSRHKREKVVGDFLFLRETRNDAVPSPAIDVADRV